MKKKYCVPTIEISSFQTRLMSWPLEDSFGHGQTSAPPRKDWAPVF